MDQAEKGIMSGIAGAWRRHERCWKDNRYVYAVVSRRSRGISVGINLNPGKECNFNCVYCQVDRKVPPQVRKVDLERLAEELDTILGAERDGSLYEDEPFNVLPTDNRGIRDIAFSGDGEPTTFPRFEEAVRLAARARRRFELTQAKLVLITNAAYLRKPTVRESLRILDENNGEIWAKLDAGTEEYFRRVNRPNVSLDTVSDNILDAARSRAVVIQSLWFRMGDAVPPIEEIEAYCNRLNAILASGGRLKLLQLYTIARNPSDPSAFPLSHEELDRIASIVRSRLPVPVETYYSS